MGAVEDPKLPVSWLWSWVSLRPAWALPTPSVPQQERGKAGHDDFASAAQTTANGGAGRAVRTTKNALPAYQPHDSRQAAQVAGEAETGFDEDTSDRDQDRASQLSDVYTNADGTVTKKTYPRPVNYRDKNGDWQPIDVDLAKRSDGRLHAEANSLDTSVAARVSAPAKTPAEAPAKTPAKTPAQADAVAPAATSTSATTLAELKLPSGESVGYSLLGAAPVAARVDGNTATYPGILAGTDLELQSFDAGIKETLVLSSPAAASSWTFPLKLDGLTPRLTDQGSVELLNSDGKAVAWFPRGSMQDSKVDPHSGAPAESTKVTFSLVDLDGRPALRVDADKAWLADPARVYPVRVDPTATTGTTGDVMIDNDSGTNNNGDNLPVGTYNGGTTKARSFIHVDNFDNDGLVGKHITAATLKLYLTWTFSCDKDRSFDVRAATQSWTVADLTAATSVSQSPSYSSAIGSLTVTDPGTACTNTAANRSVGKWVSVALNPATVDGWAKGNTNYGLALTASETDSAAWKRFTSANYGSGSFKPVLELTYSNNVAPQIDVRYPANNSVVSTLTPELLVKGHDPDAWPAKGLTYTFSVLSADGATTIATSPAVSASWTVPAGKLAWNTTYLYTVKASDKVTSSATSASYAFSIAIPRLVLTGGLAQNGGKGFDSSTGNYTTSATDASVASVGPSLAITRSYNSLDARAGNAFGTGWSSILDTRAMQVKDASGNIQSVRVTYPSGEEVAFGRSGTGKYVPSSGRFSTFVENKNGTTVTGYTLTDKDATAYEFGRSIGSGVFRLTSVTDANGHALGVAYGTDGNVSTLTGASGRKLTVLWSTPGGASSAHVSAVATDRLDANDSNSANTWTYGYSGDKLTTVCQPNDYTHCWKYGYDTTSQFGNTALNFDPETYWPFGEASGKTIAQSRVLANAGMDAARYNNVTLGKAGGLAGGTATSASFNGTSSYVQLPPNLIAQGQYQSIGMWFNTTTPGGVLLSYNGDALSKGSTTGNYTPALYIDKNGKLRGEFWMGSATSAMNSNVVVTDGKWHHVALAGVGDTQTLYVDGAARATLAGTIYDIFNGATNINVGAGFVGGGWPDHANTGLATAKPVYFNGLISDVAFYNQALIADAVATMAKAGTTAQPLLTTVTRPGGGVSATVAYDKVTGRVSSVVDENGGTWKLAEPTVAGSSTVYAASVLGSTPQDYWRFGDSDVTDAVNEVAGGTVTYTNATLNATGPFTDSTAAQFNGTSSYVELPPEDVPGAGPDSIEMWFKMPSGNAKGGVLFGYQVQPTDAASTSGWVPALYVGTDGKLRGGLWTGSAANQMVSDTAVNDGKWHHVALAATTKAQVLYLDGTPIKASAATVTAFGAQHAYVGVGRWSGSWPAHGTTDIGWWPGAIADVAFYDSTISAAEVADHVAKAKQTAPVAMTVISGVAKAIAMPVSQVVVTTPSGATQLSQYDLVNGNRLVAQTDERGYSTRHGYDIGGYSSMVYDPNGVLTQTLQDVRGNTIQSITCQDQSANKCSSVYYSYFPDATTKSLTPNPKNDLLLTTRDGRSSSATDNTYLTTNTYDDMGNLTAVTDPLGRVTTTAYTGSTSVATDGGTPPAGLPTKVVTPGGQWQTVTYNKSGDVTRISEVGGKVTKLAYDSLGRIVSETEISAAYPDGVVTTHTYDRIDREVTQSDPAVINRVTGATHTQVSTSDYDLDGNPVEVRQSDATGGDTARVEKHTYNQYGQEVSSTTPGGATTTFSYDSSGRLVNQSNPDGVVTRSVYDAGGNLTETWLIGYTGDPNDPQSAKDLLVASNSYDPAGRLATETDAMHWTTAYTYTDNGLEAKTARTDGTSTFVLENNTYDAAGNLITEVTNNGQTTATHSYDAAGREVSSAADPGGLNRITSTTYDADDNVLGSVRKDGSGTVLSKMEALYDKAGQTLAQTTYLSDKTTPVGRWKLTDGSGLRAADSAGNSPATATGGVSWSSENGGSAVFAGTGAMSSSGAVLDTGRSFSVSAWVKLADTDQLYRVVAAGGGAQQSPFDLSYDKDSGRWRFLVVGKDAADTGSTTEALSTSAPAAGKWTHLVGTYDAGSSTAKLYVDGTQEDTETGAVFAAAGPVVIGGGVQNAELGDFFKGAVSDVQVYQQALSAAEVGNVKSGALPAAGSAVSKITYGYDEDGHVTSATDPNGNTSYTSYDEDGNAVKSVAPAALAQTATSGAVLANSVAWTGYNTYGEATDTKDAVGNWSVTYYDADGRPSLQRSPSYTPPGESAAITPETVNTYNDSGQLQTVTDPFGKVTRYEYDQLDRLSKVTGADDAATTYRYDEIGDLLSTSDPTGAVSSTTWDFLGRQDTSTDVVRQAGKSYTTDYTYGTNGRLAAVRSPAGVQQSTTYNALGEPLTVTDGAGNITTTAYDGAGRAVRSTLADGTYDAATYDMAGRTVRTGSYNAAGTLLSGQSSEYDAAGNLTASVDARGTRTTFAYDATGMLIGQRQPISGSDAIETSFGYDLEGHRTRFTDGRGNAFWTTYNSWDLPESQIEPATTAQPDPGDRTFTTVYDKGGRAVKQIQPGGVLVQNTYDQMGQLTQQAGSGAEAQTADRSFSYDKGGRITSFSGVGGSTNTLSYDDRGLPTSISGPSGNSSFAYNGDGAMTSRNDAAGTTSYTYDNAGRLAKLANSSKGVDESVTYNKVNSVSKIAFGTGNSRNYSYDDQHRLTADELKSPSGSSLAKIEYGWNANDDVVSKKTTNFGGAGTVTNTYDYDLADRLVSWNNGTATTVYAYDKSGNRLQNGGKTFTYDARNRLMSGDGVGYAYTARGTLRTAGTTQTKSDAFGQVISQGTKTDQIQNYQYDGLGRVIRDGFAYTGLDNDLAGDAQSTYVRGTANEVIAESNASGTKLAWTDLHSDVVGQFTATGTALDASTVYDPLGKVVASAGGMVGGLGYQSEWTDPSTSRVNMMARWYNTDTGQFDTRDTASNSPAPNSINANRYQYGDANPLTVTDPTGHWGLPNFIKKAASAVTSTVSAGYNYVSSYASSAYSYASTTYHRASSAVKSTYHKVKKAAHKVVRSVKKRVHKVVSSVKRHVQKVVSKVKKKVKKFVRAAIHKVGKVVKSAVKRAKQAGKAIKAAAKRVVTKTVSVVKDAAKATKKFVVEHKDAIIEIAAIGAGVLAGLACTAATAGVGAVACMVGAAALVNLAKDAAQGDIHSIGDALGSLGTGALQGVAGGVGGVVAGKVATLVAGKVGTGLMGRVASEAVENGVDGVINEAVTTGRVNPKSAILGMVPGLGAFARGGKQATRAAQHAAVDGGGSRAKSLINGIGGGAACPTHSFAPDTRVLMADGSVRPIKDVNVGDRVVAADPRSGTVAAEPVTLLHRNIDRDLTKLTVQDQNGRRSVLNTTQHHPFWDKTDRKWTDAKDLQPGEQLQVRGKGKVTVVAVVNHAGTAEMRDLTVNDIHTYYVIAGKNPVLVHNCGDGTEDRLSAIADDIRSSTPKRQRPGTVSESVGVRPSGLLVAVHTTSGSPGPIPGPLMSALTACGHAHGGCSEVSGAAKLMNLGAIPESVTTVGIQSKRIGATMHGQVMAPCPSCSRLLSGLGMTSRGDQ